MNLEHENMLTNIDINNNLGDLYNILAHDLLNMQDAKNSLLNYFNNLLKNEEIKDLVAGVFYAATSIAYKQKQSNNFFSSWELPKIFYIEEWRSRRLVNDILEYKPLTKKDIKKMIRLWSTEDPHYL